jgi:hypothetical protein
MVPSASSAIAVLLVSLHVHVFLPDTVHFVVPGFGARKAAVEEETKGVASDSCVCVCNETVVVAVEREDCAEAAARGNETVAVAAEREDCPEVAVRGEPVPASHVVLASALGGFLLRHGCGAQGSARRPGGRAVLRRV